MNQRWIEIEGRRVGPGEPCYVIAELSANHGQSIERAKEIVREAKACGADAIKLQTYTADTITLDSNRECFRVGGGTLWDGRTLHELYEEAHMPWDWQPELKSLADDLGIHCFSSPFDETAIDFLEDLGVPAYKVASFEIVDLPLIEKMASTGKPLIISTGMASVGEIDSAVATARGAGAEQLALLVCSSAYPSPPEAIRLARIQHLAETFDVVTGLSDHTLGTAVPVAAAALGASLIEKHFTLRRDDGGPDAAFSLEPAELREMVEGVRIAQSAVGGPQLGTGSAEASSKRFRRSLFVVEDVEAGEIFTAKNVRSIRPADGLAPKNLSFVLGKRAARAVKRGEPLDWTLVVE